MTFDDGTYDMIGCAMRVHNALGPGLREKPYENALVIELRRSGFTVESQRAYPIRYLDAVVGDCIPDISVNGQVLVDVKSIDGIGENEVAQMLNYLRIAGFEVGLIINFKNARLETKRVVRTRSGSTFPGKLQREENEEPRM
jgi:GxxExxY protein